MSLPTAQAQLVASTLDEETARAEIYGLLADLYYAAPTAQLHTKTCASP
jgi:hypothetical protein